MRLLGALVFGFGSGCASYHCDDCGSDLTFSATPGDGDGAAGPFDCECGGFARLRAWWVS